MQGTLQIHSSDTVAVALRDLPGIHAGHKVALRDIVEGEPVIKYGFPIGHATRPIAKGELVDHHNLVTNLSGVLDYSAIQPLAEVPRVQTATPRTIMGYRRSNGQVGIRNDVWVVPTVGYL